VTDATKITFSTTAGFIKLAVVELTCLGSQLWLFDSFDYRAASV
jgi:hypothetical protein